MKTLTFTTRKQVAHPKLSQIQKKINGMMVILGYHFDYIWTGINLNTSEQVHL